MEAGQGPLRGLGSGSWQETHGPLQLGSGGELIGFPCTKREEWHDTLGLAAVGAPASLEQNGKSGREANGEGGARVGSGCADMVSR